MLILAPDFEFVKFFECHQNLTFTIIWDNLVINEWSTYSKLRTLCVIAFAVKWRRGSLALIYIYAHLWIILIRAYLLRSQLNVYLKTMFLRQTEQSVNQSCEWDVEAQSFQVWPVKVSLWAPSPKPHTHWARRQFFTVWIWAPVKVIMWAAVRVICAKRGRNFGRLCLRARTPAM